MMVEVDSFNRSSPLLTAKNYNVHVNECREFPFFITQEFYKNKNKMFKFCFVLVNFFQSTMSNYLF